MNSRLKPNTRIAKLNPNMKLPLAMLENVKILLELSRI